MMSEVGNRILLVSFVMLVLMLVAMFFGLAMGSSTAGLEAVGGVVKTRERGWARSEQRRRTGAV